MSYLLCVFLFFFHLALINVYIFCAKRFNIIDVPNNRTSHTILTIRGLGVIFPASVLIYFFLSDFQYPFFVLGLILVSVVSFIDDIKPLSNLRRIVVHFFSSVLLLAEIHCHFMLPNFILTVVILIVFVAILNAYNFMDGINGITGAYSLITLISLYLVDSKISSFIEDDLLLQVIISVIVFLLFNFRGRAIGFCGDVGSVSIAFIIIFSISMLVSQTGEVKYFFFLGLYGIDTIYTLFFRLVKNENIFEAHRDHFYQILVHHFKYQHLTVSAFYILLQLILNIWIVSFEMNTFLFYFPFLVLLLLMEYFRSLKRLSISTVYHLPENKN